MSGDCGVGLTMFDENPFKTLLSIAHANKNRGEESFGMVVIPSLFPHRYQIGERLRKIGLEYTKDEMEGLCPNLPLAKIESYGPWDNFRLKVQQTDTKASSGIVHGRYSTSSDTSHIQPIRFGEVAVAHNGNIGNVRDLATHVKRKEKLKSKLDTEIIAAIFDQSKDYFEAYEFLRENANGSYNLTAINTRGNAAIIRDSFGFQPLYWTPKGQMQKNGEVRYVASSQDLGLYSAGCTNCEIEPVKPGEIIVINDDGSIERKVFPQTKRDKEVTAKCFFEALYFLNPGCDDDGRNVDDERYELGCKLGKRERLRGKDVIVVPSLGSGKRFAEGLADTAKLEYEEYLIRMDDRRMYMDPSTRRAAETNIFSKLERIRLKQVPLAKKIKGKRVILVDDSNVRGETSIGLVSLLRECGAREVHMRYGSPPIMYPCFYGKDHSTKNQLIASRVYGRYVDRESSIGYFDPNPRLIERLDNKIPEIEKKVAKAIGADSARYMRYRDAIDVLGGFGQRCYACITGVYPTKIPSELMPNFYL